MHVHASYELHLQVHYITEMKSDMYMYFASDPFFDIKLYWSMLDTCICISFLSIFFLLFFDITCVNAAGQFCNEHFISCLDHFSDKRHDADPIV